MQVGKFAFESRKIFPTCYGTGRVDFLLFDWDQRLRDVSVRTRARSLNVRSTVCTGICGSKDAPILINECLRIQSLRNSTRYADLRCNKARPLISSCWIALRRCSTARIKYLTSWCSYSCQRVTMCAARMLPPETLQIILTLFKSP